jgi:cupin fold WbuC family metalloprotein
MENKVRLIDTVLIGEVRNQALLSSRKRLNHNFHQLEETYQRFLNILCRGTYVRPHRHTEPPKAETFLILEGKISFLVFDDSGSIIESHILQAGGPKYGIDILPGVWHSLVCISDTAVCFEGKHGPYNPANDKDFAPWAPLESTEDARKYLLMLENSF